MNGTAYNCTATATNASGASATSLPVTVTPLAGLPLALLSVQSRKTHGTAGDYNLAIDATQPISGLVTVEPRLIGTGHQVVFLFNATVDSLAGASAVDVNSLAVGTVSPIAVGSEVIVTLTGVPDITRVTVSVTGVNAEAGAASTSLGFLEGDVNSSRAVTATDVLGVKARSGQVVDTANFRYDLNASGAITATDLLAVTARSGNVLP